MTASRIRIEPKGQASKETEDQLRAALRGARRLTVTPEEAATVSGLPIALCAETLVRLAARYPARMALGDRGTLKFHFEDLSHEARASAWARLSAWYERHCDTLVALFTALVGPLVLMAAACNAAALMSAVFGPEGPPGGLPAPLFTPFIVAAGILLFFGGLAGLIGFTLFHALPGAGLVAVVAGVGLITLPFRGHEDLSLGTFFVIGFGIFMIGLGFHMVRSVWKVYQEHIFDDRAWAADFWREMGGFLVGPRRAIADPLADERRLTALIGARRGVLTDADLCGLFGWTPRQAAAQLTRLLSDYGGDIELTERGVLLYHFDRLRASHSLETLSPCWEQPLEWPKFWACSPWTIALLATMTTVALLGLWWHPQLALFPTAETWAAMPAKPGKDAFFPPQWMQGLGLYPYILVMLPPALRAPFWWLGRRRQADEARYQALLRLAIESPEGAWASAPASRALVALDGEIDPTRTNERGERWVRFPLFAAQQETAATARRRTWAGHQAESTFHETS